MQVLANLFKRPIGAGILGLILGFAVGLAWVYLVDPPTFVDATPAHLRYDLQEDYLRATIDSYRVNQNLDLAVRRWNAIGPTAPEHLARIERDLQGLDPAVVAAFRQVIEQFAGPVGAGGGTLPQPQGGSPFSGTLVSVFGILAIAVVVGAAFIFLRRLLGRRGSGETTPMMHAAQISRQAEKTNFEDLGLAPPVTQTMTTYVLGDDLYDESFSIDTQGGEFLGEYGVGVSETIGVGDPKKVTALEIWLFDKNDIKTATKVLMSAHAYNDMGIRGRLEPKGELVMVEPQKQIILETQTLQLLATVVDLEYGQGPMPPSSYFERLTLELAIWPKSEQ
jgi:hypothetical protein